MNIFNCPNCGSDLETRFAAAKMATCISCETTLFLETGHVKNAGASGDMHNAPLLFQIGQSVKIGGTIYDIIGHARFSYGAGWWDEFFAVGENGGIWISVDEGDVIVQRPVRPDVTPTITTIPDLGDYVTAGGDSYRVTEKDTATCVAFRGEFSEVLRIGATYTYVNCQGDDGVLLSGEFSADAPDWYTGVWLDQYNLEIETIT